MLLQPYKHEYESALLAFVKSHHWVTEWPERLLIRFFRELSSSTQLVFDLFQDEQRVAVAVLVDKVENPANDANLEMLAIHPSVSPAEAFSAIIPIAKQRLPKERAGLSLGFPSGFAGQDALVRDHALAKNYEMYDMLNRRPDIYADDHDYALAQDTDDEAVYTALREAFAQNPDTSIPAFADWQAARRRTPAQRTWVQKENGKVVAFLNLLPAGNAAEISTVGVLSEHRGRGHAKRLIEHSLSYVVNSGGKECKLSVAVQNERALGLYKSLGFEPVSHHLVYRWGRK